jgi:hypothetical protein
MIKDLSGELAGEYPTALGIQVKGILKAYRFFEVVGVANNIDRNFPFG